MGKRCAARVAFAGGAIVVAMVFGMATTAAAGGCALTLVTCPDTTAPTLPSTTTTTTTAPAPAPMTSTAPTPAQARAQLLALVNGERLQRGLGALAARADVEDIASHWSDSMADAGGISHDDAYFTAASHDRLGALLVGENVARASTIEQAHRALMASEHHRDNILDQRFTVIGIGATYRDGSWWITQDFLQPRTPVVATAKPRARRAPVAAPVSAPAVVTSTTTAVSIVPPSAAPVASVGRDVVAVLPRADRVASASLAGAASPDDEAPTVIGAVLLLLAVAALVTRRMVIASA